MDWSSPVLDGAIRAARTAIDAMEYDDLAPELRRIHASSARKLPPPLRAALGRALDRHEWLRAAALEHLDPMDTPAGFAVARPDGWTEELGHIEGARAQAQEREAEALRAEALAERVVSLEAEVIRLSDRLGRSGDAPKISAEEDTALIERLRSANTRLRTQIDDLLAEHRHLASNADRTSAELEEADALITRLKRAMSAASDRQNSALEAGSIAFGSGDPVGLARLLDALVESLMQSAEGSDLQPPVGPKLALSPGIRPDSPQAMKEISRFERPFTLAIDGWNVVFEMRNTPGPRSRELVESGAARFRRLAAGPVTAIVVWDTDKDVSDSKRRSGVESRFVPSADDEIALLSAEIGPGLVVVSSDRQVRERVGRHGSLAVWSTAFVEWMQGE